MAKQYRSEHVAAALVCRVLDDLIDDPERSNWKLLRLFRHLNLDRHALGVPVYKLGDRNEDSNVIELTNVVHDSGDRNWMRFDERMEGELRRRTGLESARRTRLNGED